MDRAKLVEALRLHAEEEACHRATSSEDTCWLGMPDAPHRWCAGCLHEAAADLLAEEGEPVAYEHGIRQPGGNVLWLDLGKGPAEKAYLGDGESIVRRPLYPGPVQEEAR